MIPDLAFWGRLLAVLTLELTLVVAALALVARWTRAPQLRRSLWQAGLVAFALTVIVEGVGLRSVVARRIPATYQPPERRLTATVRPVLDSEPVASFPELNLPGSDPVTPPPPLPAKSAVWWPGSFWLLGTTLLGLRALVLRAWLARERRRAEPGDAATNATVARLQGPLGLRQVELRVWSRLRGPVAFGTWRPTIAVPADFATRFTPVQREAMLAHELAHLAGRDPLWLAVADAVCALVWWHPGVWWARHQLRNASEEAADEASTLVPEGVTALAESLVVFGRELATTGPARSLGVAGSGFRSELGRRITALLEAPTAWRPLGARQRWQMRLVALGGVAVVSALPWPGTGVLGLVVHQTAAQGQNPGLVAPTREEAASIDRRGETKDYRPNPVGLTGVSSTPLRAPRVSLEEPLMKTFAVLPAPSREVVGSRVDPKPIVFPPVPWSHSVSAGLWSAPPAGFEQARYVELREEGLPALQPGGATPLTPRLVSALREAGVTVEPEVPPGSPANPPVGSAAASPAESPGIPMAPELYTRSWRLDPVRFLAAVRATEGVTPTTNVLADVRQFFALCGLEFPSMAPEQSAKALYLNHGSGALFFRSTLRDIEVIDRALAVLTDSLDGTAVAAPEVTLKVQLAEIPAGSADDLGLDWLFGLSPTNNPVTETTRPNPKAGTRVDTLTSKGEWARLRADQFAALRRSLESRNGVDFLTAPEVTTRSGRQAQVVVQDVRTIVTGVNAAVDPQTEAVGFNDVSVSATNTQPGITYQTESISTGPAVDITPHAENDGWRLETVARVTEFVGYLDPGKGNEAFVQALGAKPLTAQKPLAWVRVREMQATAFARSGETAALRGAMITQTNVFRSGNWLVRRTQTNVVHRRLYAFITPQLAKPSGADTGASVPAVQPFIVRVSAKEPGIRLGDRVVGEAELPGAFAALFVAKPNLRLLIRNDADPADPRLVAVREVARQAGIPNVLLQ